MRSLASAIISLSCVVLAVGCGRDGVTRPRPQPAPNPKDAWRRTATWLFATAGARSGHVPECRHVADVLKREWDEASDTTRCRGALCGHPAALASEWLDKCAKLEPGSVNRIGSLEAVLRDEAREKPTLCAKDLERFLDDGCNPKHCNGDAQIWATRCGEKEASPLVVGMLAKIVTRHVGAEKPVTLDPRSCATLRGEVAEAARCTTERACKKRWPTVKLLRRRCRVPDEPDELPSVLQQLSVAAGAARELEDAPVADEPRRVAPGALPLVLADGSGAVFAVCHQRVTDLDGYLAQRDVCDGGFVQLARVRDDEDGRMVRIGEVPVRKGWDVLEMFPSHAVAGEEERHAELADQSVASAIESSSVGELVTAVQAHERCIRQSSLVREKLAERDAALKPLFVAMAHAKIDAAKGMTIDLRRGFAHRARTHAFFDMTSDGGVDVHTVTGADWVKTDELWPEATAAYRSALEPLTRQVRRGPRPTKAAIREALAGAKTEAEKCANAAKLASGASAALRACVYDGCEDDEITARFEKRTQATEQASLHRHALYAWLSRVQSDALQAIAKAAGCELQ